MSCILLFSGLKTDTDKQRPSHFHNGIIKLSCILLFSGLKTDTDTNVYVYILILYKDTTVYACLWTANKLFKKIIVLLLLVHLANAYCKHDNCNISLLSLM